MKSLRTGCSFRKSPGTGLFYLYGSQFGNKRILGGYGNVPHGYWKPKTAGPDAAGIQAAEPIQGYLFSAYENVRTPQDRIPRRPRLQGCASRESARLPAVSTSLFGQVVAGRIQVDVSAYRVHGSNPLQLFNYRNLPHVPGVDDRADALAAVPVPLASGVRGSPKRRQCDRPHGVQDQPAVSGADGILRRTWTV